MMRIIRSGLMKKRNSSIIIHTMEVIFLNMFLFLIVAYIKHKNIDVKNRKDIISRKSSAACA